MVLSHLYQDFGSPDETTVSPDTSGNDAQEVARQQAFESGYQAGWDEALKAQEKSEHRIATDFARNLENMTLTYSVAQKVLGAQLVTQLHDLVEAQSENAIEMVVCPDNEASLRRLLECAVEVPFVMNVDPSLGTGQILLRVNRQEREINLDDVIIGITEAVDAFLAEFTTEVRR